jgi:hypothetical protein
MQQRLSCLDDSENTLLFEEAEKIAAEVVCTPFELLFRKSGSDQDRWYLQVRVWREDCLVDGLEDFGYGGRFQVSPHSSESEIVQKALAAMLSFDEHEIRERFTYKGKNVFNPHIDINALLKVCDERVGRADLERP